MDQNPLSAAGIPSAGHFLTPPRPLHRVHNSPPMDATLYQINSVKSHTELRPRLNP